MGVGVSSEGIGQVQVGTWLQLIIVPPRLYVSDCPSISEGKVEGSEVGQKFRDFGSMFREVREVYQRSLSKVIFRLEKEDYITCLLYYEVRSQ